LERLLPLGPASRHSKRPVSATGLPTIGGWGVAEGATAEIPAGGESAAAAGIVTAARE